MYAQGILRTQGTARVRGGFQESGLPEMESKDVFASRSAGFERTWRRGAAWWLWVPETISNLVLLDG